MKSKHAFTLVELLVVIAIIAVLLAILLPSLRNAKSLAQRLVCSNRLSGLGRGLSFYADRYDGKLPAPASNETTIGPPPLPSVRTPYEVSQLQTDPVTAVVSQAWLNLGGLYKAELISTGKHLYCPATADWQTEYEKHEIGIDGSRVQWGTLPLQWCSTSWQRIETKKGYAFWPQSRQLVKNAADMARIPNSGPRYAIGYPQTPAKYADLNSNRSISCDYQAHAIKGSGYNIQVVFSDTHVNLQKVPKDPVTGRYWYVYQSEPPPDYNPVEWIPVVSGGGINTSIYMFALQP